MYKDKLPKTLLTTHFTTLQRRYTEEHNTLTTPSVSNSLKQSLKIIFSSVMFSFNVFGYILKQILIMVARTELFSKSYLVCSDVNVGYSIGQPFFLLDFGAPWHCKSSRGLWF